MWRDLFDGSLNIEPTQETAEALIKPEQPLPTCKGVVLFCDASDRPIQLLIGANLRRLTRNRLFPPESEYTGKRADISAIVRRVYYLCCYNDFRTALRQLQIAQAVYPETWRQLVTLPRLSFVKINLQDKWPNFSTTSKPSSQQGERCFGPFPTRKSADRFIAALRCAFELCQRPDLVDSAEKAATCPYLQMSTCPAPCVGRIDRSDYSEMIDRAVSAAEGDVQEQLRILREEMAQFAEHMQFEKAGSAKKRFEMLQLLLKDDYRWTTELSNLAILHIDRAAKVAPAEKKRKIQSYAAFLITASGAVEMDDFIDKDVEKLPDSVVDCLEKPQGRIDIEQFALATFFLYRRNPAGIWINCSAGPTGYPLPDSSDIARAISERWPKKTRSQDKKEEDAGN